MASTEGSRAGCGRPALPTDGSRPERTAKDQDPERRRALELQWALEWALTTFTGHWIEDPQVLDDDRDALHWRRHCVPYVDHYLSHPAMALLVHGRAQHDGHGNMATAQLDMAMEICDQAFRQRRSYRMRYWAWLRMLEARAAARHSLNLVFRNAASAEDRARPLREKALEGQDASILELDGFDDLGRVKIIMATNRPDTLDPALLRPGRLDRKVEISLPNEQARVDILKIHAGPITKHGDIDWEAIVKLTDSFNGADMRNICTEAGMFAIRADRDYVVEEDFMKASRKISDNKKLEGKLDYEKV
ncbi:unnamed protein product [Prorocentrum cordatum]|uniref:Uncharacterized protein n=1 Tax=Prorocentrum cordatum TaxID=2364126 RepID=A0ABN9R1Z0_9DINO|nr:unnamed protein product [Polarella glacialis]